MKQLGVFAKAWTPGKVKTRLAQTIGNQAAASIYQTFVETIIARFSGSADQTVIAYSPVDQQPLFEQLPIESWNLQPQAEGDLGQRMHHYFATAFEAGAKQVVLIGTDSPDLPAEYIDKAFTLLNQADVVIGPSDDGGYYLIGMSQLHSEVFDDIPWSTETVFDATVQRLDQHAIPFRELPMWYDIDTQQDLIRLCIQLRSLDTPEPWAVQLIQKIETILQTQRQSNG
ncbi:MAG: TIGR04282 family arsenosugar biosynthesis glycosyltransferase [Pirellulales bacterium]